MYYLSTYLLIDQGERGVFRLAVNYETLCVAYGDDTTGEDYQQATCSGMAYLSEGTDVVEEFFTRLMLWFSPTPIDTTPPPAGHQPSYDQSQAPLGLATTP